MTPERGRSGASSELAEALRALVTGLVTSGDASAAVALIGSGEGVLATAAHGCSRRSPRRDLALSDRFDLASLTKPFVATLALVLDATGALPLRRTVGEIWGRGVAPELAAKPLEALLRHRAGLRAWAPLYALCGDREAACRLLLAGDLLGAAPGTYGDLDYILWGLSAEELLGRRLSVLLDAHLGAVTAAGGPEGETVECRLDNGKEVHRAALQGIDLEAAAAPRRGQPQDGNARFLAGVCGHAGLFGSARSVWELGRQWLRPGGLLPPAAVGYALAGEGRLVLGWGRPAAWPASTTGLAAEAFGHLGFTGGSLWIDPSLDRVMVLLCHRTSPAVDLSGWRRDFHRLARR